LAYPAEPRGIGCEKELEIPGRRDIYDKRHSAWTLEPLNPGILRELKIPNPIGEYSKGPNAMDTQKTDWEKVTRLINEVWLKMPFNAFMGMQILSVTEDSVCVRYDMKDELVGNFVHGPALHGGVIASMIDSAGGIIASLGIAKKRMDLPADKAERLFGKGGTIDLRVDYLRPGRGKYFLTTGSVLRLGKNVVVTRMELRNDEDVLIALGTGAYFVG
jgi:uncharacterized protein (TIGR00369 family)